MTLSKPLLSKDDERALQLLTSRTLLKDGHYESALLWRYDTLRLPDSKGMALKRLICLERRMGRDAELANTLRAKIVEYEQKAYIRRLTPREASTKHPRVWYLPIFPVFNRNKPGKLRIVWDAAATVGGISLNSLLLSGPDQLTSLPSVLYGFREFRIAITGDIREMFHQVLMNEDDQNSQRFLWRDGDSSREPDVYVTRVMTFGATCSPSCAQFVKNANAVRFQHRLPRAVECIIKEHYVDDMLASVESEQEAVRLANEVRYIHSAAGFEIRNWLSNSRRVLEGLDGHQLAKKNMNFSSEMATEKVLGMWWCTETDTFTFKLSPNHDQDILSGRKCPTKREVLKTLMTIYDPLGLIANFLMFLKVLIQEIWRAGSHWDDEISPALAEKWQLWLRLLPQVETVRVPRCYRHLTTVEGNNVIQLHVFVDASENGVAAVAYLRFEQNGVIECALVGSKTRVAPLRYLSIPRLELQAAVVGARLANSIMKSHRLNISARYFWTDSRDVVCWLRSDHRRYSQFVASRVGEILETTDLSEWNWLSTKLNVADEGTKWQKLPNLLPSSRWFRGPEFLWNMMREWPLDRKDPGSTSEELRATVLHHSLPDPVFRFEDYSKWKRVVHITAFTRRFPLNIRRKIAGEPIEAGPLTPEELQTAEELIYCLTQQQSYPEEVKLLREDNVTVKTRPRLLPKRSSLYKLCPVADENGMLRMQGRLSNCQFVEDAVKRPILLPKRHHVTNLVIADIHEKYRHINHETVLNEIRQKFYIPRLRTVYNQVRRNCQRCKILRARPQPPIMGDLPVARLAAFSRPFSYTGVDYFGPMQVTVGRRVEKRWGVLFTCLTVRAIHLEIAHSLTTDSCIIAIRNFIARRGSPIEIVSDRGTNFIGASRVLREALSEVDQDRMMQEFVSPNTKWTFNPPTSPHFGGCWERLIQSVKRVLDQVKPKRLPTDEVLRSMLMEIEMMINSRPLTHIPINEETLHLTTFFWGHQTVVNPRLRSMTDLRSYETRGRCPRRTLINAGNDGSPNTCQHSHVGRNGFNLRNRLRSVTSHSS
ncbi:uncharacterized protein LOC131679881 [Topomyia yanbarensis]|uniref:uncharacterized protein LOC131679881 n=1 Tax=Topomyia yanbarensis TaxID=2498891 RepID=UPI00273BF504|nr:uncharacterized protein LOC131679881 [Topomyia yanbarensis]